MTFSVTACPTDMRPLPLIISLLIASLAASASRASPLLEGAIQPWLAERDAWAFTQHVREFDKAVVKEDRVERYDPSRPEAARWTLLQLNGRAPTAAESAAFTDRKGRKHKTARPLSDYVDFDHVTIGAATPTTIRYEVPLREVSRLIPVDKIALEVTVRRDTHAIEQVKAVLREPLRIALGLARVTDMNFDLRFATAEPSQAVAPECAQPSGTAEATMFKFGNRAEFSWSDFTRVAPPKRALASAQP